MTTTTTNTPAFLSNALARKAEAQDKARVVYRDVLHAGATAGELSDAQAKKLAEATTTLGMNEAQLAKDAATVARHYELTADIDLLKDYPGKLAELDAERLALNAERESFLSAWQDRSADLDARRSPVFERVNRFQHITHEHGILQAANFTLFAEAEDPNTTARRTHLISAIYAGDRGGTHHVQAIEDLFKWEAPQVRAWLDRSIFVPIDGQTQAELDALVEQARSVADWRETSEIRYLLTGAEYEKVIARKDAVEVVGVWQQSIDQAKRFPNYSTRRALTAQFTRTAFIEAPGQTADELSARVDDLARKIKRLPPLENPNAADEPVYTDDMTDREDTRPRNLPSFVASH